MSAALATSSMGRETAIITTMARAPIIPQYGVKFFECTLLKNVGKFLSRPIAKATLDEE